MDLIERKKGHWVQRINASAFGFPLSIYFCSECDSSAKNAFSDDMLPNFCPNCGADMRETNATKEQREELDLARARAQMNVKPR